MTVSVCRLHRRFTRSILASCWFKLITLPFESKKPSPHLSSTQENPLKQVLKKLKKTSPRSLLTCADVYLLHLLCVLEDVCLCTSSRFSILLLSSFRKQLILFSVFVSFFLKLNNKLNETRWPTTEMNSNLSIPKWVIFSICFIFNFKQISANTIYSFWILLCSKR